MKINFVDLTQQYESLFPSIIAEFQNILANSCYVGGDILQNFEKRVANYIGTKYCVGVGSGTDALSLALRAFNIGPGDEVILPANTFIATAFAVSHVGASPVFIDVDPQTYLMDMHTMFDAITTKTKAIIPVHLYGQPCNIDAIRGLINGRNIKIIEDCAQAFGSRYKKYKAGSVGDVGCFSFYPSKNLGGIGQGGIITTNNEKIALKIRSLGDMGRDLTNKYKQLQIGFNSRLDTINAAFLNIMLNFVDEWNARRIFIARLYNNYLEDVSTVTTPFEDPMCLHIYHLYEIKCRNKTERDALYDYLTQANIGVGLHYPIPCHLQLPYKNLNFKLPIVENLANTLLSLPMHPNLEEDAVKYVCTTIKKFYKT